jgi:hypothetical protein
MTYHRSFLSGLGQDKTGSTKPGTASEPDRSWEHAAQFTQAGAGIASAIIGAATGQQQSTLPTQQPIFDSQPVATQDDTASWLVPTLVIGGGVILIGVLAYSVRKRPVQANRRRRRRKSSRRGRRVAKNGAPPVPGLYRIVTVERSGHRTVSSPMPLHRAKEAAMASFVGDSTLRGIYVVDRSGNSALTLEPRHRSIAANGRASRGAFALPGKRYPLDSERRARAAISYLHMGRIASQADYLAVRNAIIRKYGVDFWRTSGGPSWPKVARAKSKAARTRSRRARKAAA